jgi:heat-inducible transcriptional repressor
MRRLVESRLAEERAAYDQMMLCALELGRRALAEVEDEEARLFVEGASNLLACPTSRTSICCATCCARSRTSGAWPICCSVLLEEGGPRVVIGEENPVTALARGALVVATYGTESGAVGMVGLVGPVRMAYPRSLGLVTHLADLLSQRLVSAGN